MPEPTVPLHHPLDDEDMDDYEPWDDDDEDPEVEPDTADLPDD